MIHNFCLKYTILRIHRCFKLNEPLTLGMCRESHLTWHITNFAKRWEAVPAEAETASHRYLFTTWYRL